MKISPKHQGSESVERVEQLRLRKGVSKDLHREEPHVGGDEVLRALPQEVHAGSHKAILAERQRGAVNLRGRCKSVRGRRTF